MADLGKAFTDEQPQTVEVSELELTRSELRIKNKIDRIKDECSEIRDREESVQCFTLAREMDNKFDNIIRESQGKQEITEGKENPGIQKIIQGE